MLPPKETNERVRLIQHTHDLAIKALAGLMAFTLWLPITFIGVILHYCSKTHAVAYQFSTTQRPSAPPKETQSSEPTATPEPIKPPAIAQTNQLPAVEPTSVATPLQSPQVQMSEIIKAVDTKAAEEMQKKKEADEIARLFSSLSIEELEYCMGDLNKNRSKYSTDIQQVLLGAVLAQITTHADCKRAAQLEEQLVQRFSQMSDEEYARYLPLLEKDDLFEYPFAKKFDCWTSERSRAIANLLLQKVKPHSLNLWWTWQKLWNAYYKLIAQRTGKSREGLPIVKGMLHDALKIVGDNAYSLGQLYLATKQQFHPDDAFSRPLFPFDSLSVQQLALMTQGLLEYYTDEKISEEDYVGYLEDLILDVLRLLPEGTIQERIARLAVVPITWGKDPFTWILQASEFYKTKPVFPLKPVLDYYVLYQVQRVLMNQEQVGRTQQIQAIGLTLKAWMVYANDFTLQSLGPQLYKELANLCVSEQYDHFSLMLDAFTISTQTSGNFTSSMCHYTLMTYIIQLPVTTEKLQPAFARFLEVKIKGFIDLIPHIKTEAALDAAIYAIITAGFPAEDLQNELQTKASPELLKDLNLTPELIAERFQARRKEIESAVSAALEPSQLVPDLRNIVLDYFIAIPVVK